MKRFHYGLFIFWGVSAWNLSAQAQKVDEACLEKAKVAARRQYGLCLADQKNEEIKALRKWYLESLQQMRKEFEAKINQLRKERDALRKGDLSVIQNSHQNSQKSGEQPSVKKIDELQASSMPKGFETSGGSSSNFSSPEQGITSNQNTTMIQKSLGSDKKDNSSALGNQMKVELVPVTQTVTQNQENQEAPSEPARQDEIQLQGSDSKTNDVDSSSDPQSGGSDSD